MRLILKLLLLVLLLAAAWLAYALWLPLAPGEEKFVMLRPGLSARQIAAELHRAGAIRSARAFRALHYARRQSLKAGEYRFADPASAFQVYDRVARGDIYVHTVAIPEGYNSYDIAAAIEAAGLGSRQQFLQLTRSELALISDLDPKATSLEGYLFPDTYQFTRTQSVRDMLAAMVRRFRQEAQSVGLTSNIHDVVTMASIVEKETGVPEERPLVAGVFYNRIAKRIILAADPTVIYAALLGGRYDGVINQSDLQMNSPYNTYRYAGLPPGPICNPGRASLEAAMRPAKTEFLYFVSDNQGRHRFSRTMEEHARNVAAYRRAGAR